MTTLKKFLTHEGVECHFSQHQWMSSDRQWVLTELCTQRKLGKSMPCELGHHCRVEQSNRGCRVNSAIIVKSEHGQD